MMKKLDENQKAIEKEYLMTRNNIFINASAGSGKSTTAVHLAKITPKHRKMLFVAFNKSIVEELKTRVPDHVHASTIHSLCYRLLRQNVRLNLKLTESKNFIYCRQKSDVSHIKKHNSRIANLFNLGAVINLMKLNLTEPTPEKIVELANTYGYMLDSKDVSNIVATWKHIEKSETNLNPKREGMMDFTDMLYFAYTRVPEEDINKYDVVVVDECQDLNPLQYNMILRFLKPNGRLISVGDSKQLIYGFMGSNLSSFNEMRNRPNTTELPLSVSYRCPKKVVEFANTILPGTDALPDAPEGVVKVGYLKDAMEGDYIICRNNAPLVDAFTFLTKMGKRCSIMGKEFGNSLLSLIDRIENIEDLVLLLEEKELELSERGVNKPKNNAQYVALKEKVGIVESLYNFFGSMETVSNKLMDIYKGDKDVKTDQITLSTIHKSKGLQADRVFILNWHLLPSEYATSQQELDQEKCLQYVAVTRAKKELTFCEI